MTVPPQKLSPEFFQLLQAKLTELTFLAVLPLARLSSLKNTALPILFSGNALRVKTCLRYLGDHWRGHQRLLVAFGLNFVLLDLALYQLASIVQQPFSEQPRIDYYMMAGEFVVFWRIIYFSQILTEFARLRHDAVRDAPSGGPYPKQIGDH